MVQSNAGLLSRIIASVMRWLHTDARSVNMPASPDAFALPPAIANGHVAHASPATSAAPSTRSAVPTSSRPVTDFLLPARLHGVAKLNPRKDRAKAIRRGTRAGKPVTDVQVAVR